MEGKNRVGSLLCVFERDKYLIFGDRSMTFTAYHDYRSRL